MVKTVMLAAFHQTQTIQRASLAAVSATVPHQASLTEITATVPRRKLMIHRASLTAVITVVLHLGQTIW